MAFSGFKCVYISGYLGCTVLANIHTITFLLVQDVCRGLMCIVCSLLVLLFYFTSAEVSCQVIIVNEKLFSIDPPGKIKVK